MNAEQNCNDNTANQEDERLVSPAVPFWMHVTVKPENSALSPEPDAPDSSETAPESDETFAILMQAIEGTEIARRLGGPRPRGNRPSQPPSFSDAPAVASVTASSETPIAGPAQFAATTPEPAPVTAPQPRAIEDTRENDEICTNLLRAIEGTNIARQLGIVAPGENGSQEPVLAEAVEAVAESTTVEAVCATPPHAAAPEVETAHDIAPLDSELDDARENGELSATAFEVTAGTEFVETLDVSTAAESVQDLESALPIELDAPVAAAEPPAAELANNERTADTIPLPFDLGETRETNEACITVAEAEKVDEPGAVFELAAAANSGDSQEPAPIAAKDTETAAAAVELFTACGHVITTDTESTADSTSLLPEVDEARGNDEACATLQTTEGTEIAAPAESGQESETTRTVEMNAASADVEPPHVIAPSDAPMEAAPAAKATPRPPTRRAGARVRRQTAPQRRPRKLTDKDLRHKRTTKADDSVAAKAPPAPAELMQEAAELQVFESPTLPEGPAESTSEPAPAQRPAEVGPVLAVNAISNPTQAPAANATELAAAAMVPESAPAADVSEPAAAAVIPESAPAVIPPCPPTPARDSSSRTPVLTRLGAGLNRAAIRQPGDYLDRAEMHLQSLFLKWFDPPDPRRRSARLSAPPLAAYHWTMDVPQGLKIANISSGGMCLVTHERWTDGVIVSLTLQRTDMPKGSAESWIAVDFVVTRWCEDGIAGAFIPSRPGQHDAVAGRAMNCADKKTLERFVMQLATPAQIQIGDEEAAM